MHRLLVSLTLGLIALLASGCYSSSYRFSQRPAGPLDEYWGVTLAEIEVTASSAPSAKSTAAMTKEFRDQLEGSRIMWAAPAGVTNPPSILVRPTITYYNRGNKWAGYFISWMGVARSGLDVEVVLEDAASGETLAAGSITARGQGGSSNARKFAKELRQMVSAAMTYYDESGERLRTKAARSNYDRLASERESELKNLRRSHR